MSTGRCVRAPSGLAASLASFARNFAEPTPTEAVSPSVLRVSFSLAAGEARLAELCALEPLKRNPEVA